MVEKIKEAKDQVLRRMEQAINERGVERMDVAEMGKLADIVKDLAEAEKSCWEAEYYMSVTDAMNEGSMGYDGQPGYSNQGGGARSVSSGYRMGYPRQPRDAMGRFESRRGYMYGYDPMQGVREAMMSADPQERERMQSELRQMLGM